ncbi:MAG: response regulator transcription factor [Alphaproteobacteria bacterium]|nr:response regulator transcription factor [Alphaproteobacteria bacterium]
MSAVAVPPAVPLRLRVAVSAIDPATARRLAERTAESGHMPVPANEPADAGVSDGLTPAAGVPVVAVGVEDGDFAGVLPHDAGPAQLDAALRAVAAGLIVRLATAARPGFAALPEEPAAALTPREVEVLAALAEGLGNKAVARRLGISPHTVKFHIESVFRKLGAGTRAEAVAKGLRRQIVEF